MKKSLLYLTCVLSLFSVPAFAATCPDSGATIKVTGPNNQGNADNFTVYQGTTFAVTIQAGDQPAQPIDGGGYGFVLGSFIKAEWQEEKPTTPYTCYYSKTNDATIMLTSQGEALVPPDQGRQYWVQSGDNMYTCTSSVDNCSMAYVSG